MAFLKKLKAAFGFGDAETDEELSEKFLPYEAQHRTPYINPFKKEDNNIAMEKIDDEPQGAAPKAAVAEAVVTEGADVAVENMAAAESEFDELPAEMFNGVLSIINSTLPAFVRSCLDVEAEKRAIAKALGPHIKNAMLRVRAQMAAESGRQWSEKQVEMEARVEQAESRAQEATDRAAQAQTRVQVAEAQRNAANERCRSLEARIAELEAEHEQFELENKSLVNKVKVAQVYADDIEHYKGEIAELRKQIAELKEGVDTEAATAIEAKWSEEVARLQQEIAAKNADIDALTKKEEETAKQLAATREELDDALATVDIVNEVQVQVEKQCAQIKQRDEKIAAMREQSNKREAEAARSYNELNNAHLDLKLNYDLLKAEAQRLRDAIANADKDKEEAVAEMQEAYIKAEKEVEDLKKRLAAMKNDAEEAQKQSSANNAAIEERNEEMKKQLEAASLLIERRDATIQELNDKINAMSGELSFARVSESENRLKIRQLTADLENERLTSKQLADKLAARADAEESHELQEGKNTIEPQVKKPSGRKPGRPPKVAKVEPQVATIAEEIEIQDVEATKPEPELEEAVKHVFKIDFSNDAADSPVVTNGDAPSAAVAEDEPLVQDGNGTPVPTVQPIIDVTVSKPVEPSEPTTDLLSDEQNIDNTFEMSGNDIPALDDDIEWLMPTAHEDSAADDNNISNVQDAEPEASNKTNDVPPAQQQQMSLF